MELPPKPSLRAKFVEARRALGNVELHALAYAVQDRAASVPEISSATIVALYWALPYELDTSLLWQALRKAGKRVVFPRVLKGTRVLSFSNVEDITELAPGQFGICEPPTGQEVPLSSIDCFVVPGIAFDEQGRRLGRGGGYYDATLAAVRRANRLGICLDSELIPALPYDEHDMPMNVVVTPSRVVHP